VTFSPCALHSPQHEENDKDSMRRISTIAQLVLRLFMTCPIMQWTCTSAWYLACWRIRRPTRTLDPPHHAQLSASILATARDVQGRQPFTSYVDASRQPSPPASRVPAEVPPRDDEPWMSTHNVIRPPMSADQLEASAGIHFCTVVLDTLVS
jgi:hypothetical protein